MSFVVIVLLARLSFVSPILLPVLVSGDYFFRQVP